MIKWIKGLDVIATRPRPTPGHPNDVKTRAILQAHDIAKELAATHTPKYKI
jgi:hypothetical protein